MRRGTPALVLPEAVVDGARQVSVTGRWHHGRMTDPGRRRPGGSASSAHATAAPGCPALARTGTHLRRDLRRRRRRPGHREPQHLLPALPRHRHAAGRRPRRTGCPRRRRPHPDLRPGLPPRRLPTCWCATPRTSPRTSPCTAARSASTAPPSPSHGCADASTPSRSRASSCTMRPRPCPACPGRSLRPRSPGRSSACSIAWLERDPLPPAQDAATWAWSAVSGWPIGVDS